MNITSPPTNFTDEIYDVLNKNAKKVGTATWTEVHAKGLIHQVVAGFVFKDSSKSEILLQQRSTTMAQDPGKWAHSFGGHVLSGQALEAALNDELKDELFGGRSIPLLTIKLVASFFQTDFPNNNEYFRLYEIICPGPFSEESAEVKKLKWVKWNDLLSDIKNNPESYTQSFHNSMAHYLAL